jgi:hypothetical protein
MSNEIKIEPIDTPNPDGLDPRISKLEEMAAQIQEMKAATASTPAPNSPNPAQDWQRLADERQAEIDRLKAVIAAGRLAPQAPHPNKDARPGVTAEQLRAQVGPIAWHKMTEQEKIAGLGLNPAEIDRDFLKKCFGRGNDCRTASELHKSDPLRYRRLREVAIAIGAYAA